MEAICEVWSLEEEENSRARYVLWDREREKERKLIVMYKGTFFISKCYIDNKR